MSAIRRLIATLTTLIPLAAVLAPGAAHAEKRIALVVGNAAYQVGSPLATPANDAGLIAQTLQAAGFDVVGARDLDQDSLRHAFRDFLDKATNSGPDTVAFVYVGGYGLQLEGENYFVPIDAKIARDSDIPAQSLRISDYSRPLAALKLKAGIVVVDGARASPFAQSGAPLAGGLALVEPDTGLLIAFNAAPGTIAPETQGPYGPYAQAVAEMLREGGLPVNGAFERARLRVNELTAGAEVPWHASKLQAAVVFFERTADAPPPAVSVEETAAIRARPIRDLGVQEGYTLALERDTIEGYNEFLAAYPEDPMARRVRALVAARREATIWRRTCIVNTPPAYWSYLRRYPEGPHVGDAHRRLTFLAVAFEPPPRFVELAYDLPPPPPEEIVFIRRPVLVFDDPVFGFGPPPPIPVLFLAPPPPEFVVLVAPPPPIGLFVLPIPIYRPVPVWVSPPRYVAPPPANNIIYNNIHNTVVVNNVTNTVSVTNRSGQTTTLQPPAAPASGQPASGAAHPAAAGGFGPSLPPSVAQKAVSLQNPPSGGAAGSPAAAPGKPGLGQPLPGARGQPLPAVATPGLVAPSGATPPAPGKPGRPGAQPGGTPPSTSAAVAPAGSPTTAPGSPGTKPGAKPAAKPARQLPAAKLTPPAGTPPVGTPHAPGTPPVQPGNIAAPPASAPAAKLPPTNSRPPVPAANAKPVSPPAAPAAKLNPAFAPPPPKPPAPPPPARVVAPPPPARVVAPAPPPLPAPPRPAAPAMAPAAAAAKPAAPGGCPPGRTAAVVNGLPTCR